MDNKKKFDLKQLFSNKKFKYGGYSAIVTLVVIGLVVLVNYGMTVLENNYDLKIDTTQNKKYSLSDQTKTVVAGLTKDINIYTTYKAGSEDKDIQEILQKLKALSPRITLQNVDPDQQPVFMQKFETNSTKISSGDVIVSDKDAKLYRVLSDSDQYSYTYDQTTYAQTKSQIKIEGSLVSAIDYIQLGYKPTIYMVQGHGEPMVSSITDISDFISGQNYDLQSIDIAQSASKIKSGDIIMIYDPQKDITSAEKDILKPLMQKGGRFYIMLDPQYAGPGRMANLESLLMLFDISLKSGVVIEGNQNNYVQYPFYLVPNIQSHAITTPLTSANYPLILPSAGALKLPDSPPDSSIKITSLLKTSDQAYLKSYDSLKQAQKVSDLGKQDTDESGTFDIGAAVDKTNGSNADDDAKMVLMFDTQFASQDMGLLSSNSPYENGDLFLNSLDWMRNGSKTIYVRPKSISTAVMNIRNAVQFWVIVIVAVALVPLIMLVLGIVIYQRRKHL